MRTYQTLDRAEVETDRDILTLTSATGSVIPTSLALRREGLYLAMSFSRGPAELALRLKTADVTRALPHPDEVRGRVVGQPRPRVDPRERPFVVEQERFVRGEELRRLHRIEVRATGRHELHRLVDVVGQPFVADIGGIGHEALGPVVDVAQIGEPAHREGTHEVEGG